MHKIIIVNCRGKRINYSYIISLARDLLYFLIKKSYFCLILLIIIIPPLFIEAQTKQHGKINSYQTSVGEEKIGKVSCKSLVSLPSCKAFLNFLYFEIVMRIVYAQGLSFISTEIMTERDEIIFGVLCMKMQFCIKWSCLTFKCITDFNFRE